MRDLTCPGVEGIHGARRFAANRRVLSLAPLLVKQAQTSIALLLDIVHIGDPHGLVRLSMFWHEHVEAIHPLYVARSILGILELDVLLSFHHAITLVRHEPSAEMTRT